MLGYNLYMRRIAAFAVCLLLASGCAHTQTSLSVSPSEVVFRSVAGGFQDVPQKVNLTASGNWTASIVGEVPWLNVKPEKGQASGTLTLSLVDWAAEALASGDHTAEVVVAQGDSSQRIKVTATIVPQAPKPNFSYLGGPKFCLQPPGYDDQATCTVPDEKPPGAFVPPRLGGSYVDPNFGALVRVIAPPRSVHSYSTPSAVSAQNKYVLVNMDGGWSVVSPVSGKVLHRNIPVVEGSMWDARDPEILYFISGTTVNKYTLTTGKTSTLVDYAKTTPRFASITAGGAGDTSKDNWISFYAPQEKIVCALDLNTVKTYCGSFQNVGRVTLDPSGRGTLIAKGVDRPTGKRYIMLVAYPTMAFFSVNLAAERLDFEFLAPERPDQNGNLDGVCDAGERCYVGEHNDTFEDAGGVQYLIGDVDPMTPCSYAVVRLQINKGKDMLRPVELGGGLRKFITLFRCSSGDVWTDLHYGCAKQSAYCVVSTTYGRTGYQKDINDLNPIRRTAHLSEIMVIKGDGSEIRRLAEHRSVPLSTEEALSYWSTPRASISEDGAYVVADSNFGEAEKQRVILIETGYGKTRIAALADAATFAPTISPGGIASIFGLNLANCNDAPGLIPLPEEYCGTTVRFGILPARFFYASTGQLNVQVPRSLPPSAETFVTVSRGSELSDSDTVLLPASAVSPVSPGIYSYSLEDDVPRAVVQNVDPITKEYSLNGPLRPEYGIRPQLPGEAGVVYANNLGATSPEVADGHPPESPLTLTRSTIDVYINNVRQSTFFAGLAPLFVGLYQVNYWLAPETPVLDNDQNRIWLRAGGLESPPLNVSLASDSK